MIVSADPFDRLLDFPLWYGSFILSITAHEAAHALAAYWGGDDTAYQGGQVTLNPLPHMQRSPVGTIVLPILTYFHTGIPIGWANAPYDPFWRFRYPRRAALMALAGPLANLLLGLLAMGLLLAGLLFGVFHLEPRPSSLLDILGASPAIFSAFPPFLLMVMFINIILFAFNLLPIPPLDGFSVLPLVLPQKYHQTINTLTYNLNVQIFGMMFVWLFGGELIAPILQFFLGLFTTGLRWVA